MRFSVRVLYSDGTPYKGVKVEAIHKTLLGGTTVEYADKNGVAQFDIRAKGFVDLAFYISGSTRATHRVRDGDSFTVHF